MTNGQCRSRTRTKDEDEDEKRMANDQVREERRCGPAWSWIAHWSLVIGHWSLVICLPALARAAGPPDVPLDRVVGAFVRELGAERYDARERATEALRRVGPAALPALEQAAKSDDPEVRLRARDILADVRLGIGPDWPADVALLVRHYDRLGEQQRPNALQRISGALGVRATPLLVRRLANEGSNEAHHALNLLQRNNDPEVCRQIVAILTQPKSELETQALAWARARLGHDPDAIEALAKAQTQEPAPNQAAEAALQDVVGKLDARQFQDAAAAAEKLAAARPVASSGCPADPRPLYLQAEALAGLNRDKQALALRDRALALNPDKEPSHHLAARLLIAMGRARLAAREWQRILEIPPDDSPYELAACLHLASVYAADGLFESAAQYLEKGVEACQRAAKAPNAPAVPAGTLESLQAEVSRLRQQAAQYPASANAALEDPIPESDLEVTLEAVPKEGKPEDLQRALANVAAQFHLTVEPPGTRLFDLSFASVRHDAAKKQLLVLFHEAPACKPLPFDAPAGEHLVAIHTGDCTYIFKTEPSGKAERIARFEKNYRLTLRPGIRLAALADVALRISGKVLDWDEARKGLAVDLLPTRFDITIEGTTPVGKRITFRLRTAGSPPTDARETKPPPPPPAAKTKQ